MEIKKKGRKRINVDALKQIDKVKRGKSIVVHKDYWLHKKPPGAWHLRQYLNKEFKVETLQDESGWVVTRK